MKKQLIVVMSLLFGVHFCYAMNRDIIAKPIPSTCAGVCLTYVPGCYIDCCEKRSLGSSHMCCVLVKWVLWNSSVACACEACCTCSKVPNMTCLCATTAMCLFARAADSIDRAMSSRSFVPVSMRMEDELLDVPLLESSLCSKYGGCNWD